LAELTVKNKGLTAGPACLQHTLNAPMTKNFKETVNSNAKIRGATAQCQIAQEIPINNDEFEQK